MILMFAFVAAALAGQETEKEIKLDAGKVHEECMNLNSPQRLNYDFQSPTPVSFNIHYHEGKKVHFPEVERERRSGKGIFEPASKQDYCLMWTNKSKAPVTFKYRFTVN